mmetsp:Transcript_10173/g.30039  ORF Transcript_10173/g.30039 Transcript_10173/m.30039 type:complete len:230 (+) Transcript_10173:791-1480(+)
MAADERDGGVGLEPGEVHLVLVHEAVVVVVLLLVACGGEGEALGLRVHGHVEERRRVAYEVLEHGARLGVRAQEQLGLQARGLGGLDLIRDRRRLLRRVGQRLEREGLQSARVADNEGRGLGAGRARGARALAQAVVGRHARRHAHGHPGDERPVGLARGVQRSEGYEGEDAAGHHDELGSGGDGRGEGRDERGVQGAEHAVRRGVGRGHLLRARRGRRRAVVPVARRR